MSAISIRELRSLREETVIALEKRGVLSVQLFWEVLRCRGLTTVAEAVGVAVEEIRAAKEEAARLFLERGLAFPAEDEIELPPMGLTPPGERSDGETDVDRPDDGADGTPDGEGPYPEDEPGETRKAENDERE